MRSPPCSWPLAQQPETEREPAATDDAAQLGAVLQATGVLTPLDSLARSLRLELRAPPEGPGRPRELPPGRPGCGLHRLGRSVALARSSEPVPADVLGVLIRKHLNRDGITLAEGRVLYRYMTGNPPREPTNSERVATGALTNAELRAPDPSNPNLLRLADDVRYSLLLDEEPDPPDVPLYRGPRRRREENRNSGCKDNRGDRKSLPS